MIESDDGYFGEYGGRFVPEILFPALDELEQHFSRHPGARTDLRRIR